MRLNSSKTRRMGEPHPAPPPFAIRRNDIFRYKNNLRRLADQAVFLRVRRRCDQCQNGRPVWRRYAHPALTRLQLDVERERETQLIKIETQAPVLVPHVNVDGVYAQIRTLPF